MDLTRYATDVTGHAIQFIPAMLLYFRCVPRERYRFSVRKTIAAFSAAAFVWILATSAVKLRISDAHAGLNPDIITFALLVIDFILLLLTVRRFVFVHAGPNRVIVILGLLFASLQYTIVRLVLIFHTHADTYDGRTLTAFFAVTAVLFPVTEHLMAPWAKEYLLVRDKVRPQVRVAVLILASVSLLQIFAISYSVRREELPLFALMSVSINVVYMLLIRYVVVEEQRTRTELHLLASQIKPHFIRNTLNAICNLVDEDPDATIRAIYDFSGYLRMNFEALEKDVPVPFAEELEHTKFYLSIEKLRFRDELQIEIDTPVTDFRLPALTVQPMVENAVRHGLRAKEGTGRLLLSTRETQEATEVVIRDDGVGFQNTLEEDKGPGDNGGHYGLVNVRSRLKRMVGGALLVESEPGKGTTVIIQIPKRGNEIQIKEKEA